MSLTNLPPTMDRAALKDFLMSPPEPFTSDERMTIEPYVELVVDEIFTSRGNPRTIPTPIAASVARLYLEAVEDHVIGSMLSGGAHG